MTRVPSDTHYVLVRAVLSPGATVTGFGMLVDSEKNEDKDYFFTGKERDATGLYYFGARYYDPEVGRFITEDPAQDGEIWYGYCSNPICYFDPDGQKEVFSNWLIGILAHQLIELEFLGEFLPGKKEREVIYRQFGIVDLVYTNGPLTEFGEIKPYSYSVNYTKWLAGMGQVFYYVDNYNKWYKPMTGYTAIPLTEWNPNGRIIPIPGTDWKIEILTFAADPGMIYYKIYDNEPEGTKQPDWQTYVSIWVKAKNKMAVNGIAKAWNDFNSAMNDAYSQGSQSNTSERYWVPWWTQGWEFSF